MGGWVGGGGASWQQAGQQAGSQLGSRLETRLGVALGWRNRLGTSWVARSTAVHPSWAPSWVCPGWGAQPGEHSCVAQAKAEVCGGGRDGGGWREGSASWQQSWQQAGSQLWWGEGGWRPGWGGARLETRLVTSWVAKRTAGHPQLGTQLGVQHNAQPVEPNLGLQLSFQTRGRWGRGGGGRGCDAGSFVYAIWHITGYCLLAVII